MSKSQLSEVQSRLAFLEGFYAYFEDKPASSYRDALKVEWVCGWNDAQRRMAEDGAEDRIEELEGQIISLEFEIEVLEADVKRLTKGKPPSERVAEQLSN